MLLRISGGISTPTVSVRIEDAFSYACKAPCERKHYISQPVMKGSHIHNTARMRTIQRNTTAAYYYKLCTTVRAWERGKLGAQGSL